MKKRAKKRNSKQFHTGIGLAAILLNACFLLSGDRFSAERALTEPKREPASENSEFDSEPAYEISEEFQQRASRLACDTTNALLRELDQTELKDFQSGIEASLKEVDDALDAAKTAKNRKSIFLLRLQRKTLKSWRNDFTAKSKVRKLLGDICESSKKGSGALIRPLTRVNQAILLTGTFPLRWIWNFSKGLVRGKPKTTPMLNSYEVFGPNGDIAKYLLTSLEAIALDYFLTESIVIPAVLASQTIDYLVLYRCQLDEAFNPELKKFCDQYQHFREGYDREAVRADRIGVATSGAILFRSRNHVSESLCRRGYPKQDRVANRVLGRHQETWSKLEGYDDAFVYKASPQHTCVSIRLVFKDEASRDKAFSIPMPEAVDGVLLELKTVQELKPKPGAAKPILSTCEKLRRSYNEQAWGDSLNFLTQTFLVSTQPDLYATPIRQEITTQPGLLREIDATNFRRKRHLIFSVGPSDLALKRYEEPGGEKESLERDQKLYKESYKKIIRLQKKALRGRCESDPESKTIDLEAFDLLFKRLRANKTAQSITEESIVKRQFYDLDKKLALRWEYHSTTQISDVFDELKKGDVATLLIVAHGQTSGHLLDSVRNQVPKNFFRSLSEREMPDTVALFSCHGSKSESLYEILDAWKATPSASQKRLLFTLKDNSKALRDDVVPFAAFREFLKQVDRQADLHQRGEAADLLQPKLARTSTPVTESCHLRITGLEIQSGHYAALWNQKIVGFVNPSQESQNFEAAVDCTSEKHIAKNRLVFKNISTIEEGKSAPFEALEQNGSAISLLSPKGHAIETSAEIFYSDPWQTGFEIENKNAQED